MRRRFLRGHLQSATGNRFRLLSACRAQISPIFGLFRSDQPRIHAELRALAVPPAAAFHDEEGVLHQLTPLADAGLGDRYAADLRDRQVFIADGHHRYETALRYQTTRRGALAGNTGEAFGEAWYDYVMILLVEMSDHHAVFEGEMRLDFTQWNLTPPRLLMLRVEPEVVIRGRVHAERES